MQFRGWCEKEWISLTALGLNLISFATTVAAFILFLSPRVLGSETANPSVPFKSNPSAFVYVVQKNDTLFKFFRSLALKTDWIPTAGRKDSVLEESVHTIPPRSFNLIYPGDSIHLTATFEAVIMDRKNRGLIDISKEGQIVFLCSPQSLKAWVDLRTKLQPDLDPFDQRYPNFANDCLRTLKIPLAQILSSSPPQEERKLAGQAEQPLPLMDSSSPESSPPLIPKTDSQVDFLLGSGFSQMKSKYTVNGSEAHLLSGNIISMEVRWIQHWSSFADSFVKWSYFSAPFERADVGILENRSQFASTFAFGGILHFPGGLDLQSAIANHVSFFSPSYSAGTASLEKRNLPALEISLMQDLARVRSLKLSAGLGAVYIGSTSFGNYQVHPGLGSSGLLHLEQNLDRFRVFTDLIYQKTNQNTSLTQSEYNEVWMKLGFSWNLGNK